MAANDSQNSTRSTHKRSSDCLSLGELAERLDEEVSRAERHRTALSCLLVSLEDVDHLASTHGERFPAQALDYLGDALGRQLRRFDRIGHAAEGELLVVLPGADERRGEIVARRALGRLHAVKIEVDGERHPLRVSMGIAAWRQGLTAQQLLSHARLAARRDGRAEEPQNALIAEPRAGAEKLPLLRPS
jgi:diguanylate cyclase (GGDEF)-like protein